MRKFSVVFLLVVVLSGLGYGIPNPDGDRQIYPQASVKSNISRVADTVTMTLDPMSSPASGGAWIHITFSSALDTSSMRVFFDTIEAAGYANPTSTTLDVLTPAHPEGSSTVYDVPNPDTGMTIPPLRGFQFYNSSGRQSAKRTTRINPNADRSF